MKFSLFVQPAWPQDDPSHQSRVFAEAVEQIQYAEELGFDSVWLAEHHFTRFGICPLSLPFAYYAAAKTNTIRVGTGVSVLTFQNPIFVAEESAMLDVLSNGRLDFGVGRGQVVYEYGNFKVDYESRTQRFKEILDIVLGLWSTAGFTYHGDYYQVDDLTIAPWPVQKPHPPLYLAVSRTPASVDVAIERGLPVMTGANTPDEDVLGIRKLYAERCAAAGVEPRVADMPFFRLSYVAADETQAREEPRAALSWIRDLNGLRRTLKGGSEIYMDLDDWRRTRPESPPTFESELKNTAYFGTPDQMVEWIQGLQREHDVQYFGVNMDFGTLTHEQTKGSMELFAKEVMPKFR